VELAKYWRKMNRRKVRDRGVFRGLAPALLPLETEKYRSLSSDFSAQIMFEWYFEHL